MPTGCSNRTTRRDATAPISFNFQCRPANSFAADERRAAAKRQRELLEQYRAAWEEPTRGLVAGWAFRNGFPERVTLDCEHLVIGLDELAWRSPVVRVRLRVLTPLSARDVADSPALAHVRELDLAGTGLGADALAALLASPHLERLRALNLGRNPLGDDAVRLAVDSPRLRQLQLLGLSAVGLTPAGVSRLLGVLLNRRRLALRVVRLGGAPRLSPGAFYRDFAELPAALRVSLEVQLTGRMTRRAGAFERLRCDPTALPPAWRGWLASQGTRAVAERLGHFSPGLVAPELRAAVVAVCARRRAWRAARKRPPLPEPRPSGDLAALVAVLAREAPDGASAALR